MDDKELIERTKNSFKAKKSKAEILEGFQKRGYKLAYADKIIEKANRPKKITITLAITIILFLAITVSAYTLFSDQQKSIISNPLTGFTISNNPNQQPQQIPINEIEITPEFISYLLQEMQIEDNLHSNLLEKPIINFKIEDKTFSSEIGKEIETTEGLNKDADLQFNTNKQEVIKAITSENPELIFRQSLTEKRTQIELLTSEPELFSKGYLKLYDSLK